MPALRDKTTIGPLEWVLLDGRTKDFWAHNGDGKARRYTFLALADCATPRLGQAKTAERTFAGLSQVLDDRPEFKGAHAGHKPGATPDSRVVPVHLEAARAVCTREVARYNAEMGRRGQGMKGQSYQPAFEVRLAKRVKRTQTDRQLYLSGLIYQPATANRWGQVEIDTWTYGAPDIQEYLLKYRQQKESILFGRDPDDFGAPAVAWNAKIELICDFIQPVKRGAYGSVDDIRQAAASRKAAREAVSSAAANNYLGDVKMKAAPAAIPTPGAPTPTPAAVLAGQFSCTLKTKKRGSAAPAVDDEEVNLVAKLSHRHRFLTK